MPKSKAAKINNRLDRLSNVCTYICYTVLAYPFVAALLYDAMKNRALSGSLDIRTFGIAIVVGIMVGVALASSALVLGLMGKNIAPQKKTGFFEDSYMVAIVIGSASLIGWIGFIYLVG
jgi:hypothetical protein